jgi:hypothetical protein
MENRGHRQSQTYPPDAYPECSITGTDPNGRHGAHPLTNYCSVGKFSNPGEAVTSAA